MTPFFLFSSDCAPSFPEFLECFGLRGCACVRPTWAKLEPPVFSSFWSSMSALVPQTFWSAPFLSYLPLLQIYQCPDILVISWFCQSFSLGLWLTLISTQFLSSWPCQLNPPTFQHQSLGDCFETSRALLCFDLERNPGSSFENHCRTGTQLPADVSTYQ